MLASPRWKTFWVWQAIEVYHWGGVWMESARITSSGAFGQDALWIPLWYGSGIVLHMAAVIWICVTVVKDILDPERDPVRAGLAPDAGDGRYADPGDGVFADHPDRFLLPPAGRGPVRTERRESAVR